MPYPAARYAWFVIGTLSLINMVSFLERQIITLMFGPIKKDFSLSDTEVSLLAGFAFVVCYVLFGLVVGRLADRMNRKRIILFGIIFWSIATVACGFARSFVQLFLARVAVGIGESTLGPSAASMISDYFPRKKLARALSLYSSSNYIGNGLALVAGGAAIAWVASLPPLSLPGFGTFAPWQMTFILVGVGGLLVLLPFYFVKEPARQGVIRTDARGRAVAVPYSEVWAFFHRNRRAIFCHFAAFSISAILGMGKAAWIPTYFIRVHGWSVQEIGLFYGLIFATAGAAGVIAGGWIVSWMHQRGDEAAYFRLPIYAFLAGTIPGVAVVMTSDGNLAIALLVISTFIASLPVACIGAGLQMITPNQMRGQVIAIFHFVGNIIGPALGPIVVALITDYIWKDEMAVGQSIATMYAIIIPICCLLLWYGMSAFRRSMVEAESWTNISQKAQQ